MPPLGKEVVLIEDDEVVVIEDDEVMVIEDGPRERISRVRNLSTVDPFQQRPKKVAMSATSETTPSPDLRRLNVNDLPIPPGEHALRSKQVDNPRDLARSQWQFPPKPQKFSYRYPTTVQPERSPTRPSKSVGAGSKRPYTAISDDADRGRVSRRPQFHTPSRSRNSTLSTDEVVESPSRPQPVVDLSSDDEVFRARQRPGISKNAKTRPTQEDEEEKLILEAFIDLTKDPSGSKKRRATTLAPKRNLPIHPPFARRTEVKFNGKILRPGMTVEPTKIDETKIDNFLLIRTIVENCETGDITLRGTCVQRAKDSNGLLDAKLNEAYLIFEVDEDDPRPPEEQDVREMPLSQVKKVRELRITNRSFPQLRFRDDGQRWYHQDQVYDEGPLVARWKYTVYFAKAADREKSRHDFHPDGLRADTIRFPNGLFEHLQESDGRSLSMFTVSDEIRRIQWRGETIRGGSYKPPGPIEIDPEPTPGPIPIEIDPAPSIDPAKTLVRPAGQMYTYGDAFCGAGGATRGAEMAGLKIVWGMDHWRQAMETWRENFPKADAYECWADEFIKRFHNTDAMKVDFMHMSPPCQFFSPAHTVMGQNDETNTSSLLACGELLKIARPRVVTLEETAGIALPAHRRWLHKLINMFTAVGYSVRWRCCLLTKWGLPQRRLRLVMIAAGPGEKLPDFPRYTHDASEGLKPFKTINSVLSSIPLSAPDHDPASMQSRGERPYDGDLYLPRCITTNGGQNWHPSGNRGFTIREYASLQGFPLSHKFTGMKGAMLKQIGNAVPSSVAKILFTGIRKALEDADNVEPSVPPAEDVVVLD